MWGWKRSLDFARDDPVGFGVMVCNIGDILLHGNNIGNVKLGGLGHRRLYPFDSEINFLAQGDGSWEGVLYKSSRGRLSP